MRLLVIGAGVAGLTLAGRLCQQGRPPVVVDRASDSQAGYALGLYPLGTCVLHGVGAYERLLDRGLIVDRYLLADGSGRLLQDVDMSRLTGEVGPMVMVGRAGLIDVLEEVCGEVDLRRGVSVSSIGPDGTGVDIELSDGSSGRFDAVVAADGMASAVRQELFGLAGGFDSGWTLLTWWAPADRFDPSQVSEWWGRGCFFGAYPAPEAVMCAAGGPTARLTGSSPSDDVRNLLAPVAEAVPLVANALADVGEAYRWPMRDIRAGSWVNGRVALCGDAAVGFLPTAGVGASNAMRCAAGLADELSRADAATLPSALQLYEKRCRKITEANQTESRRLGRVMFMSNRPGAWLRDQVAKRYPAEKMLAQIISSSTKPF